MNPEMGKKAPLSPALGGGSRRDDTGGQLLRELEALSQVLYNAGQQNGRPPRKESPSSPFLGSLPGPRRSEELHLPQPPPLSPHLAGRPYQTPPSPHLGASRDSLSEDSSSPYLSTYANRRMRDSRSEDLPRSPYLAARNGNGPPSPYLGGLDGPQPESRSPVIVSLNSIQGPAAFRRSGSRREGGGRPPMVAPLSPHIDASRGHELPKSPLIVARRSVDSLPSLPPRSPHLGRPTLPGHFTRPASESSPTTRSLGSLNITELTLSSAAAALRSPHQRPPAHARSFSPLSQSVDLGKKVETYRLDGGRESPESAESAESGARTALKPWHSQGFEKNLPEVTNFPSWLEDNVNFSKQLEAPKEKRSLWNWGPFKALSHIGAQRFNCMFTVHVHGIEGLPAVTNGLRLAVSWKRKEAQAQSMPGRVFQGSVEFEESLYLKSTVYGTKDGSKGLKFEPKCFDLAVIALDVDELVLGKHRLDLSRLLPKTAEARKEENDRSWTTSFKLAGKAKGGTLIVTFGCQLLNKNSEPTSSLSSARFSDSPMAKPLRSYNSLPSSPDGTPRSGWAPTDGGAFSPAMSEMPIDGEYMRMEHLSLNDDFDNGNGNGGRFSSAKSSQKGEARPSFSDTTASPRKLSYSQQAATSEREDLAKALYDEDDGSEFNVVCQGHETSSIVDTGTATPVESLEWDDPKAEEDVVQGLSDGDVHEDLLEDSAFLQSQIDVEMAEDVKVISEDKSSRNERAEVRDSQVVEVGTVDKLAQVFEGLGKDRSPVASADPELRELSENSVGVEKLKDGGKEEKEQIIEVNEDWSVSAVDDLDVLTQSWSVGVAPGNIEEHVISREEFLSDDNDGEDASVAIVESKDDEETSNGDIAIVDSEDDEETLDGVVVKDEEEEKTPDVVTMGSNVDNVHERKMNLVVAESDVSVEKSLEIVQSMSTPTPQVKTREDMEEDDYDLVTGEFLSFLRGERGPALDNYESGEDAPDSPRALLLQQFEQEALIEGGLELNFHLPEYAKFRVEGAQSEKNDASRPPQDIQPDSPLIPDDNDYNLDWGNEDDVELAAILEAAEAELEKATQILKSRARAKLLEDEETKALMEEWGLNDRAFSPQYEEESDLSLAIVPVAPASAPAPAPPLGNGLGPVMRIRDGGSLRSMSPTHFRAGGRLLLQASDPVVVDGTSSEMGATSMEMLQRMAVAGMEGMAAQAMMAMPLEDLTGMALDQISVEQRPAGFTQPLASRSQNGYAAIGYGENSNTLALRDNISGFNKQNGSERNSNDEHLGLEDIAPTAMLKIEALALEGLKIQAEMADQDAPYTVEPLADEANHKRASQRGMILLKNGNLARDRHGVEGGLMSSAVSLNEWMSLDAGVYDEDDSEEHTVGHKKTNAVSYGKHKDKSLVTRHSASRGVKGDTVTLSMLVQLRDPFRNNEPVGAPMMALVQAERVRPPLKTTLGHRSAKRGFNEEENEESTESPKFKIVDITVAGLETAETNTSTRKLDIWNKPKQLAAGSRWLVAHGMGKSSSMRSKPAAKHQRGESLWSISSRVHGSGAKWRDSHIRNPNVIFADTSIRTY
ncbi:hypothetical protein M758_4G163300 [Ceratodon purpureus]|nr:hypothetical protein M758_4G163300 [Ceratodon purpureus]